jgi:hypothetical protein
MFGLKQTRSGFHLTAAAPPRPASAHERFLSLMIIAIATTVLIYIRLFDPTAATGSHLYPPCPFHALTGLYCPGCGSTRALHQLLHGHLAAAFGFNPLMILALPFIAYAFTSCALVALIGRSLPKVFIPPLMIRALFGLIVLFWIARNIPFYPFTLLAP